MFIKTKPAQSEIKKYESHLRSREAIRDLLSVFFNRKINFQEKISN